MNFSEIIKKVNSDKRLKPDLMKAENGNNFRAISESAILDVISPVLEENGIFYVVEIKEQHLDIKEAYGSKGKKLQFIATLSATIRFLQASDDPFQDMVCLFTTEAVGMGIDDNDKAMGKAYTYAIKYALLKLFRLRYGDDPDYKASEPLLIDKPKEQPAKEESKKPAKKENSAAKEKAMTEAQRDYILGMMEDKGITTQTIMGKFGGYDPIMDEYIPMKTARAMIKWLEEQEALPF